MAQEMYKIEGPWGGAGGDEWTDGTYSNISGFTIGAGDCIHSIQVNYTLNCEGNQVNPVQATRHGGGAGGQQPTIQLESNEYLSKIEGEVGIQDGHNVVKSLTLIVSNTDKKVLDKPYHYGTKGDSTFKSDDGRKIVGFWGRSSGYVDKIGVYTVKNNH
uniref:Jacalin-type lectin domain-containing protein n=1 Tax=Araucaria cunninghamii TaxID=56994 RepID=A0A0D6QXX5_ARACU